MSPTPLWEAMDMDRLIGQLVKVIFSDNVEKAVQGSLDAHDDTFVYLTAKDGNPLVIGKKSIISIMPVVTHDG